MKRIYCLIFSLLFVFSLCACEDPGEFHSASGGDVEVNITESSSSAPQVSADATPLLGKWELLSLTNGSRTVNYINSYFDFRESGTLKTKFDKQEQFLKYSVTGNLITIIEGATYNTVTYKIEGENLTIYTQSGGIQRLVRAKE